MPEPAGWIMLGSTGLVGSALREHVERRGERVIGVHSANYQEWTGAQAKVLVNCNGNSVRFRANQDPAWDFEASVATVQRSLFDFTCDLYVYCSTVDVYDAVDDPSRTHEDAPLHPERLIPYAFHKWIAERLVQRYARRWVILRLGSVVGPGLKKNPVYDVTHGQPVHLSLESAPTFIDTGTIAQALDAILASGPQGEIFNLTGTGSVSVRELAAQAGVTPRLAPGAEAVTSRYHINTGKLGRLLALPSSADVTRRYIASLKPEQAR